MNRVMRPEWLKVGAVVRVQFWVGVVRDIAETDIGRLFVWVYGPKNAAYGQRSECLEFSTEHIRPATDDEIEKDCDAYTRRMRDAMEQLERSKAEVCDHG